MSRGLKSAVSQRLPRLNKKRKEKERKENTRLSPSTKSSRSASLPNQTNRRPVTLSLFIELIII